MKPLMTVAEVAEVLGLTRATVWRMCRQRRIPHHVFGRDIRFSEADLLAILQESRVDPETTIDALPVPIRARRRPVDDVP
ncbi:helix-turn-helix domain-containing protein [Terracoccus sp. 273MFTsu3.1]|uniref:helix-turn-helix domain-containing protein n=1 Tax=Terracoccus sp. 273MFTsu3.1 TaxID=1172188 RepID=UPI00036267A9